VQARNEDEKPASALGEKEKNALTETTGRVWEDCDQLVAFANGGLGGFVVGKASQWLELMKDAVKELQEYDLEEDDEDGEGEDGSGFFDDGREELRHATDQRGTPDASATIKAGVKAEALKVLTRVPQSMHVVVKQRLAKLAGVAELSTAQRETVDAVLAKARQISECIDECAENMYMGDLEGCLKRAGQARQMMIEVVESVRGPWTRPEQNREDGAADTKEDLYIRRALEWVRQVEPSPVVGVKEA